MTAKTASGPEMLQQHRYLPRATRDPALDGLRGVAVLMVYVFHYGGGLSSPNRALKALGYLTQTGWTGVVLFFALSGFLITGILWDSVGEHPNAHWLRNFYLRRALRILPLYYAVLVLAALVMLARGAMFYDLHVLGVYALFLQNFPRQLLPAQLAASTLPLYHLWSLAVEEQFYLLWPFLLLLFRSRRAALQLCLWTFALSAIFLLVTFGNPRIGSAEAQSLSQLLCTNVGPLALGAALAIAFRGSHRELLERFALPAFLIGLALYCLSSYICGTFLEAARFQFVLGLPAVSLAAAAAIPLLLREGLPRRFCSTGALRFLGRISYGFYVFHILLQPVFDALGHRFAHSDSGSLYQLARFVAGFPITLLVSWISFHWLELPFLRMKRFFPSHEPLPANLEATLS